MAHIKNERRCVACRNVNLQTNLIRFAKINNNIVLDKFYNLQGRGAYVCKNKTCINNTIKKHLLNKTFKMNVDAEVYNQLGEYEQN